MQTLEHYTGSLEDPAPKGPRTILFVLLALLLLGVSIALIQTRLGVAALLGMAFVAGAVIFAVRRSVMLIEVVAFLIHFDGIGLGQVTLGRTLSVVIIAALVYKLVVEKWRPPALPTRHWIGPLALVTWSVASASWSADTGSWMIGVGTVGLAFAFFAAAGLLVDSYDKISSFLRAYWYGGLFGAGAGLVGLVTGVRAFGFNADANLFGVLAASMIPLTIYYRRNATTPRERFIYAVVLLVVLGGAAGAGSRSGIIGAGVALFGSLVYRPGESLGRRLFSVVPAGIITCLVALLLLFANPQTVVRGTDSSGRTDFWRVTRELIAERPLLGHGESQIYAQIPGRLATTPGIGRFDEPREKVSSHNTWLDYLGNLGVIGFSIFGFIFVVTAVGLLRPRWKQTKELSGYLFLMFLPVLTGSMFLTLANNKLGWSMIGLAGILQVPSWERRYRGYFSSPAGDAPTDRFSAPRLARWDLKISQRFRIWVLLGAILGAVAFGGAASSSPARYSATISVVVPILDASPDLPFLDIDLERTSVIHTLALSDAYAAELMEQSGSGGALSEIRGAVSVDRTNFGPLLDITFESTDRELVETIAPHMLESLDSLIEGGRDFAEPTLRDELRPTVPGEQRYYTGPVYLPISDYVDLGEVPPDPAWNAFVGALTGALVATGYVLLQQRRPRVNDQDDFSDAVGLELWSHVGRARRGRNAATANQYAQVAVRAIEAVDSDRVPTRIVVAGPTPSRSTRMLALGTASALVGLGHRVVLVDGQVLRPRLSRRLGFLWAPGVRELGSGAVTVDRAIRRVKPLSLPRVIRRALRKRREDLRFVSAGRVGTRWSDAFDPSWVGPFESSVITVVLAPPLNGKAAVGPVLGWADVVMYDLAEGETVTFDAEDGALQVATFATGAAGVILSDV